MLTTIDLDNESLRNAGEIDDESAHRMLTPEFVRTKSTRAQQVPEASLRAGLS
jgi:hypothetical protein